jgi:hypothetical protein
LTRSRDLLGASTVGEETVVTDAVETVGRMCMRKRRINSSMASVITLALTPFGAIVFPLEGHARVIQRDQAAVRDGDAE